MAKGSLGKVATYNDEIDLGFIYVLNELFNNVLITDSTEVNVRYMSNSLQNSFRQRDRMLRNLGDTPRALALEQHGHWVFQVPLDGSQELGPCSAINHAVVARKRQLHPFAWYNRTGLNNWDVPNGSNGQNTGVWRVDNGRELLNPEHT